MGRVGCPPRERPREHLSSKCGKTLVNNEVFLSRYVTTLYASTTLPVFTSQVLSLTLNRKRGNGKYK